MIRKGYDSAWLRQGNLYHLSPLSPLFLSSHLILPQIDEVVPWSNIYLYLQYNKQIVQFLEQIHWHENLCFAILHILTWMIKWEWVVEKWGSLMQLSSQISREEELLRGRRGLTAAQRLTCDNRLTNEVEEGGNKWKHPWWWLCEGV